MAGGKLSFAVAINLLTDNFKRGANTVKNQFNAMKFQALSFIAALGVGSIGLSNFVSRLVSVTRETNRANTALKNVSGTMGQFAADQKFLLELANKYGIEINTLTESYAKFSAAAKVSGMSTEDQRKVFESVSRACTAFGMSATDTNGVMLALSQMMGKGKISSEELRKQMGERLPVALQAMAKAAGVSVAGLEKLMSQGKLLSKDILPEFANALNEMIPTVDTDNLETSLSRLSNTFTELVNQSGFQERYKALIDWSTDAMISVSKNLQNIFIGAIAVVSFAITNFFSKIIKGWWYIASSIPTENQKLNAALLKATAERVSAEKALETAKLKHSVAIGNSRIKLAQEIALKEKLFASSVVAEDRARLAFETAIAGKRVSVVTKSFNTIKVGAAKMIASLKNMWSAFSPAIIVSAITLFIGKLVQIHKETQRIKSIFSEYRKEVEASINTSEIVMLEAQLRILNDKKSTQEDINNAQAQLQKMLGNEEKSQDKLIELTKKRVELLKQAAKADVYSSTIAEYDKKNFDLARSVGLSKDEIETLSKKYVKQGDHKNGYGNYINEIMHTYGNKGVAPKDFSVDKAYRAISEAVENLKVIEDATSELQNTTILSNQLSTDTVNDTIPDSNLESKKTVKSEIERAEENYINKLEELNNKLANKAIKQHEYNKAIDDLNKEIYEKTAGLLTPEKAVENETFQKAKAGVENPLSSKTDTIQREYEEELNKLSNQKRNEVLTGEQYIDKQRNLIHSTLAAIGSLDEISEGGKSFIESLRLAESNLKTEFVFPELELRDTTFDYKKTDREKTADEKRVAEKNLDNLKGFISGDSDQLIADIKKADGNLNELKAKYQNESAELIDELNKAIGNVNSLEEALKIAEVKEDIKSLNKELNRGIYTGMKDIASNADRLVSSFSNLKDVFNDADASEWEKILAVFNALTQTIDGILSIVDLITRMTEITKQLSAAKQVEAAIDQQVTNQKLTNVAASIAATQAEAANNAVAATKTIAANTSEAAATVGKSAAGAVPFPFNILAVAGAIAGTLALFSTIPKFANGGIVSGRTLAEVGEYPGAASNPEVIAPLSKLKQLIKPDKAASSGVSGDVRFRIEGNALVGVLNNYSNRMSKLR